MNASVVTFRFCSIRLSVFSTLAALLCIGPRTWADQPFRIAVTVEQGPDRGQNLGSLFEITDANGRVVAGAGFQGAYNTHVRGERELLQVFVRSKNPSAAWQIERLPAIETTGTGFYPFSLGGDLHVYNHSGPDPIAYREKEWRTAEGARPQMQYIAGKLLEQRNDQLVYDGVTLVDAGTTQERIGEFYFARGNLIVRQFGGEGDGRTNRIAIYPWTPEEKPTELLRERSDLAHRLSIPYEFFYTFGQWQDEVLGITNVGTVLRLTDRGWQVLREPILTVSYQVYCGIDFYDQLLLGHYPSGVMFQYAGGEVKPLDRWPPVMKGVATSARELQSAAIYGGDLYVGVWPWAEVWRYDAGQTQWDFVQRMFTHPELTDKVQHPYEAETKQVHDVANNWGQRVTGLLPYEDSLIITTSSKGGQTWDPKFVFLSPEARADYSAVYRLTLPGNLAVRTKWKSEPTTFEFTLADGQMMIRQDDQRLGTLEIGPDLQREFQPANIRWGEGVFGPSTAKILNRESTLAHDSLSPGP